MLEIPSCRNGSGQKKCGILQLRKFGITREIQWIGSPCWFPRTCNPHSGGCFLFGSFLFFHIFMRVCVTSSCNVNCSLCCETEHDP